MNIKNILFKSVLLMLFTGIFISSALASYLVLDLSNTIKSQRFSLNQPVGLFSLQPADFSPILPKFYIVQSGSMEPSIKTGSIVITKENDIYNQGDIVSFKQGKNVITHRIGLKTYPEGIDSEPIYKTLGDANEDFDSGELTHDKIIGKVVVTLPYLGYLADWAKRPYGFILLVIVPATIIIYEEIKVLFLELSKFLKRIFSKYFSLFSKSKKNIKNEYLGEIDDKKLPRVSMIFPIFGAALVLTGLTGSFFSDKELSPSNIFQAASVFPGQPGSVVINEVYYFVCIPASTCGNNPQNEWFELYNLSSVEIDLSNWSITDNSSSDTIPSGTKISPHGFLVITSEAHTFDIWTSVQENQKVILGSNIGNGLNDNGDRLILKNTSNVVIDSMSYGDDNSQLNPAPAGVDRGHSLEREPDGKDTNQSSDFVDRASPSPGS